MPGNHVKLAICFLDITEMGIFGPLFLPISPKNAQNTNEAILRLFVSGNHYDDRGDPPKLQKCSEIAKVLGVGVLLCFSRLTFFWFALCLGFPENCLATPRHILHNILGQAM